MRGTDPRYRRPRDAASIVLVREREGGPEVLMGRRHAKHAFMPDLFVFPGGRVDPGDARVPVARPLAAATERHLRRQTASPARARALAVAAVRETYEETGLVIGAPIARRPRIVPSPWRGFLDRGLAPALDRIQYIFHAITPPGEPRRFNARFFLLRLGAAGLEGRLESDGELGELAWIALDDALALPIPWVTGEVLKHTRRLLAEPGAPLPVPFYRQIRGKDIYEPE